MYGLFGLGCFRYVLDKVIYTLANPVNAGLVKEHHLWPGAISNSAQIAAGRIITKRPIKFFAKTDDPALLTRELVLTPIPGAGVLSQEDYGKLVCEREKAEEARIAEEREVMKLPWMGRRKCLAIDPYDTPVKPWVPFSPRPTIYTKNEDARRYRIQRQKRFAELHDEAKKKFRDGERDVAFPEGTFYLRVYFKVPIEPFK